MPRSGPDDAAFVDVNLGAVERLVRHPHDDGARIACARESISTPPSGGRGRGARWVSAAVSTGNQSTFGSASSNDDPPIAPAVVAVGVRESPATTSRSTSGSVCASRPSGPLTQNRIGSKLRTPSCSVAICRGRAPRRHSEARTAFRCERIRICAWRQCRSAHRSARRHYGFVRER
jgi:hypothetical protein